MPSVFYRCSCQLVRFVHFVFALGLILLTVLAAPSVAMGQEEESDWTASSSTPDFDEVLGVSALPSGVLVAGSTAGTFPVNRNLGGGDAFVSKYDAEGNEVWTRQFGTPGADRAASVAADAEAIYLAGSTTGTVRGQTNTGDNLDAFVRKSNPEGFEVWTRQFGTLGSDQARSMAVDSSGVYVVGAVEGPAAGYNPPGGPDAFIRKYDFDGNLVWDHEFGTTGSDDAFGVSVHSSGVYVAGTTSGTFPGQSKSGGSTDVFVRKYDSEGRELWTRQSGTLGTDQAFGIAVDPSGVYIAGATTGTLPRQSNYGGSSDTLLVSYDFEGNQRWVRQYGTEGTDDATGVVAVGGYIFVTGSTSNALPDYRNSGDNLDAILLKYHPNGNRIWARQMGTPGIDRTSGVAAHLDRVYIAGNIDGSFPRESDGFITSVMVASPVGPEVTPTVPAPTPVPETSPPPTATPTPVPAPMPTLPPTATPTAAPSPTPSPAPTPTPIPAVTPLPTEEPTAAPTPTPRPTATPWPTPTPRPTFVPLDFSPPDDDPTLGSQQLVILGIIGVLAVIALIGVVRKW